MKRITLTLLTMACSVFTALADGYKTEGNGTTWTFSKLAEIPESGITRNGMSFTMTEDIEIASGDNFTIESGITVAMADNVRLSISSDADFTATEDVLFTASDESAKPFGITLYNSNAAINFRNINFEHVGVKFLGTYGANIDNCKFMLHNGVSGTSALNIGNRYAQFRITNSIFEKCSKSAIGGAANYPTPVIVDNCVFTGNGTANTNHPQLNLTTAENVTIRNCKIIGNPEHNMVGGLVVSNLVGMTGDMTTLIENNEIRDNRFGLATYCEQNVIIRNNTIINNKYESNPMSGGSGINIYDPQQTQTATITGNYIEGNLWGITVIGGKDINIGKTEDSMAADYNPGLNIFLNNGNGGCIYDLYNNSKNTVYAQGNFWKTAVSQTEEEIEKVIYHKNDNPSLGEVIFMPALQEEPTDIRETTNTGVAAHEIEIYNLSGMLVKTVKQGTLPKIAPGQYILHIKTDNGIIIRKIIV